MGQRLVTVKAANTHHHIVSGFNPARIISPMLTARYGFGKRAAGIERPFSRAEHRSTPTRHASFGKSVTLVQRFVRAASGLDYRTGLCNAHQIAASVSMTSIYPQLIATRKRRTATTAPARLSPSRAPAHRLPPPRRLLRKSSVATARTTIPRWPESRSHKRSSQPGCGIGSGQSARRLARIRLRRA